jgi:N-acetyl-gamma-glutamyl-phosphate reductase
VADQMPALQHLVGKLTFTASDPEELAANPDIDLFFLALPHGVASEFADPLFKAGKTIIDLSADFRLGPLGSTKIITAKPIPPHTCSKRHPTSFPN